MNDDLGFLALVNHYLDGSISSQDVEKLNDRLRSSPDAQQLFIEWLNLDSALESAAIDVLPEPLADGHAVASGKSRVAPFAKMRRGLAALAATVIVCVSCIWILPESTCGIVQSSVGVPEFHDGQQLFQNECEISAGTLKINTPRGVQIAIEAPARFRFESAQRLHLMLGRLAADVPPSGRKFTVVTPSGEAVDLGTRFGIDVPLNGEPEVHVFQGEVIAQSSQSGVRRNLHDGEAFHLEPGAGHARDLRSAAFIRLEEVDSLHAALQAGRQAQSKAALERMRSDPDLIALLDFESPELPEGKYRMVQGRWPGSCAPEFVHAGDHMKFNIGGERGWPQLTLAAWVRLDLIDSPYHSLLHTDGWGDSGKDGQVHWTVMKDRKMRLAMFGSTLAGDVVQVGRYPTSGTPVVDERGRWVHLAAVFDAERRTVRFYSNGIRDSEALMDFAHPAQLGSAQIGNWNKSDRRLGGRIDELVLLGRAMSDQEIHELFMAGNPYLD